MNPCAVCGNELGARWINMRLFEPISVRDLPLTAEVTTKEVRVCSQTCQTLFEKWVDLKNDLHTGKLRI